MILISLDKLIYLAGLFDGEGTFSIQVNLRTGSSGRQHIHCNPRMSMSLKYGNAVLDELVEAFGGRCYDYPASGMRKWCVARRELLLDAARALLPHLRVKRRVCERFIEALEAMPNRSLAGHSRVSGERSWSLEQILKVTEIALTLNPGGKPSPKKKRVAQVLEDMRAAAGDT